MVFYKETSFKETPIGKIPKDWDVARLEDVSLDFIGGGTPATSNPDYWNGDIAWMTSAHINGRIIATGQRYITKKGLEDSATNLVPKDNLIVATRVGIGKAAINKIDIAISQDLTGIVVNRNKAVPDFLYWVLMNNERRLKSLAQGSTIKGILREKLGRLYIPRPLLSEQQEITEILSTVDEAIQKVDEVIAKTERLKKGLMQELLTKGIGHKEFKDTEIGRIPKDWEVVKLEEASEDIISGGTPSTKEPKFWNGDIPWIRSAHITKHYIDYSSIEQYITKEGLENSAANIVPRNNLIVATRVGIGKSAVNLMDVAINQDLTGIVLDKSKVDPVFIVWYLYSPNVFKLFESFSRGTTIKGISQSNLRNLLFPLPSFEEQQKIAEVLSTVDKKLGIERKGKATLERIKQGLMDLLLTGKIRVKAK